MSARRIRQITPLPRLYHYVGPPEIVQRAQTQPGGARIASPADLTAWIASTRQCPTDAGVLWATFVVDANGFLRLADRRSEHVACASGQHVRSAGEIAFISTPGGWVVAEVSNQSTGYCPEPESWPQVAAALDRIPLPHPAGFTFACIFRRCRACDQLNLVKDGDFTCALCGVSLPASWNLAAAYGDTRRSWCSSGRLRSSSSAP